MAGYQPMKIAGMATGLVQEREDFLLPNDAYPILENAFVWRERIRRKQGWASEGRLRRVLVTQNLAAYTTINGTNTLSIFSGLGILATEPNANVELGNITTISIVFPAPISQTLTDTTGTGTLTVVGVGPIQSATINYASGIITITANAIAGPATPTFSGAYYPSLPVMGLRLRELNNINLEQTVAFDQKYAYININDLWQEFIPGTTWTGTDSNFFWTTNYWVTPAPGNHKLFWVTNFSGVTGDPIRYTDGSQWVDFAPIIDSANNRLEQCLALLPFRGRLVAFNTLEGATLNTATAFTNRIRWAAIGNPVTDISPLFPLPENVSANAWRDDIRGKGGFLDIPTSESIVCVGFVRDNCVIYCERSTWQLRYTGRSVAPFQIERVNSELGAESTFSAIQFDTSLVGIGDKGVVECDSYKSKRIDIKIPDLVFEFDRTANGVRRVHGIRDFQQRLAYWTYPYSPIENISTIYPNRLLVYNEENDSWAIFTASFTCFGTFQPQRSLRWQDIPEPWEQQNYPWINRPGNFPEIVAGNQQGYVMVIGSNLTPQVENDPTLYISGIVGNGSTPTILTVINHNMLTGTIIQIVDIPAASSYSTLNGNNFYVLVSDPNTFSLLKFNAETQDFTDPQVDPPGNYFGGGQIFIRDNFSITSKKFNAIDDGQKIQLGYVDILMNTTSNGAISMYCYMDYNNSQPINTVPENINPVLYTRVPNPPPSPDDFFNIVIPTTTNTLQGIIGTKQWQRVYCPTRAQFITIEYTLNPAQMNGVEQQNDVQIDAQILWLRNAGRLI